MTHSLEEFRDPLLATSGEVVGFYPREFFFLDNFSAFQVEWRGRVWPTSEHGYHAAKYMDHASELVEEVFVARSPHDALKVARANQAQIRDDWDEIKVPTMTDLCRHKLTQHPYIQRRLLETGDLVIIEDSPKDDFWGWGADRKGRNELGKIWMLLRQEIGATAICS